MESILQDFFTNITQRIETLEKNYMSLFDERLKIAGIHGRIQVVEDDIIKLRENQNASPSKNKGNEDLNNNTVINKKSNIGLKISPSKVFKLITNNSTPSTSPKPPSPNPKTPPKVTETAVTEEKDVITPDDMDLTTNEDDLVEKEEKDRNEAEACWDSVEPIESTCEDDGLALSDDDEPFFPQESSNVERNAKRKSSSEEGTSGQQSNTMNKKQKGTSDNVPPFIIPFPLSVKNESGVTSTSNQPQHQLATKIARRERSKESAAEETAVVEAAHPRTVRTRNSKDGYFWNQCYVRCNVCSKKVCPGWNGYGEDLDKAIIWHAQKAHKIKEQEARNWKKTMFVHTCLLCNKKLAFMLNPIITHINEAHDMALKKYEDQFYEQLESIFNELSEDKSMPKSLLQAKAQRQQMREKVIDID